MADLAPAPYRLTVGPSSSGWVKPGSSSVASPNLNLTGAGSRKLLQLANGWLVAAGYSESAPTGVRFMVSKDDGLTWTQLAYLADGARIDSSPAIAAVGNNIVGLIRYNATNASMFVINALTQTDDNILGQMVPIDGGLLDIAKEGGVSIAAKGQNVHAVWLAKVPGLENSYNLRYSGSTDGGYTWSTPSQLTYRNASSEQFSNSVIAINGVDNPLIMSEYRAGSSYVLARMLKTSTGWIETGPFGSAYPLLQPNLFVDGPNVYMVWANASTSAGNKQIKFSKSTDNGVNWGSSVTVSTGHSGNHDTPAITADAGNKLYLTFSGIASAVDPAASNLRLVTSSNGGTAWSAAIDLTSFTNGTAALTPAMIQNVKRSYSPDNPLVLFNNHVKEQTEIGGTAQSGIAFNAPGLTPDTKYRVTFEVKDKHAVVRSVEKAAYTLAETPTLAISQPGASEPAATLTDGNPVTTKYQVMVGSKYVGTEGKLVSQPTSLVLTGKTLKLKGLDPKKTYAVKVRAINQEGTATSWSNAVRVGPPIIPPAVPKNVQAQAGLTSILLTWSPVSEATDYEVEVDNEPTYRNTYRGLSYTHQPLLSGTLHQYRVRAVKEGTPGPWSAPVVVRTLPALPTPPAGIGATATARTATITWIGQATALAYEVEWDGQVYTAGRETTFKQVGLPLNSRHAFRVRTVAAGGNSPWSERAFIATTNTLPAVPVAAAPIVSDQSVVLRWAAVSDAVSYDVEADGVTVRLGNDTSATFTGLSPGSEHSYRIRSVNELGVSSWTTAMPVTMFALPTPVFAPEVAGDTGIALSWNAIVGATGYEVEADGVVVSRSVTDYTHSGLTAETAHTYRVRALGGAGSAWSAPLPVWTLPVRPATPTGLHATAAKDRIYLNWSAVPGATGYDIEIDGQAVVDNGVATAYTDILLDPFSAHQYRVRARTTAIEGEWSTLVSLRTLPDKPAMPAGIAVTSAASIVTLNWTAEPSATKYEVEVNGAVIDNGTANSYKHRRVETGAEQKYRIRTTNASGTGEWSGLIVTNTLRAQLVKTKSVDMGLVGVNIRDFSRYTLKVTYDPGAIEIMDLSTYTSERELTTGRIAGTDVTVTSFVPGEITYVSDKAIAIDETWTGVINNLQMRAKVSGGSSITYSVIERP